MLLLKLLPNPTPERWGHNHGCLPGACELELCLVLLSICCHRAHEDVCAGVPDPPGNWRQPGVAPHPAPVIPGSSVMVGNVAWQKGQMMAVQGVGRGCCVLSSSMVWCARVRVRVREGG